MRFLIILAIAAALAGCSHMPVVPDDLLNCRDQPASPLFGVPVGQPIEETQEAVALYVPDLADAGQDCRTKLGSVRRILKD